MTPSFRLVGLIVVPFVVAAFGAAPPVDHLGLVDLVSDVIDGGEPVRGGDGGFLAMVLRRAVRSEDLGDRTRIRHDVRDQVLLQLQHRLQEHRPGKHAFLAWTKHEHD